MVVVIGAHTEVPTKYLDIAIREIVHDVPDAEHGEGEAVFHLPLLVLLLPPPTAVHRTRQTACKVVF